MNTPLLVILDDDSRRLEAMTAAVKAQGLDLRILHFKDAPSMLAWLKDIPETPDLMSLDHDLDPLDGSKPEVDPGTGRDVCDALAEHQAFCPVIIHTSNSYAAPGMTITLEMAGWIVDRAVPHSDLEWIDTGWAPLIRDLIES